MNTSFTEIIIKITAGGYVWYPHTNLSLVSEIDNQSLNKTKKIGWENNLLSQIVRAPTVQMLPDCVDSCTCSRVALTLFEKTVYAICNLLPVVLSADQWGS